MPEIKTVEEIAKDFIPCTCGEIYLSRNLKAPDCPLHSFDIEAAILAYHNQFLQQEQSAGVGVEEILKILGAHIPVWTKEIKEIDEKFTIIPKSTPIYNKQITEPILFADWIRNKPYYWVRDIQKYVAAWNNYSEHTTKELYDTFIQENILDPKQL